MYIVKFIKNHVIQKKNLKILQVLLSLKVHNIFDH